MTAVTSESKPERAGISSVHLLPSVWIQTHPVTEGLSRKELYF